MKTIREALQEAVAQLATDSARLDAEVLLAHVLGKPRSHLFAWPEKTLAEEESARFATLIARRASGEPVAYLTGRREFWSLELEVTPATLIPRPETELLVEEALSRIPADAAWHIADLGTGSGAIALAIASERPRCRLLAVDRSPEALAVAERNRARLGLSNLELRAGDWFEPLADERFQMILANPPYVAEDDPHLERGDVRHEPRTALAAGPEGLDALRRILEQAPDFLTPPGWLLLEHGRDQATAVERLLLGRGFRDPLTLADIAGHPRLTLARLVP